MHHKVIGLIVNFRRQQKLQKIMVKFIVFYVIPAKSESDPSFPMWISDLPSFGYVFASYSISGIWPPAAAAAAATTAAATSLFSSQQLSWSSWHQQTWRLVKAT